MAKRLQAGPRPLRVLVGMALVLPAGCRHDLGHEDRPGQKLPLVRVQPSKPTHEIARVSVSWFGGEGGGWSAHPSISGDGRFVAFGSDSVDIVPDDKNNPNGEDVFVRDRKKGVTERVNVSSSGAEADRCTSWCSPSISADGRFVAFTSPATNLVPSDTSHYEDIFVHDRETGLTERVSVSSSGSQADQKSGGASISAGGRFVVFQSYATNLVPGDANGPGVKGSDVFVHDRETGRTERVSVNSSGGEANEYSCNGRITPGGRFVAFQSKATNLVPGDMNGRWDIFVHDRKTGTTERVSVRSSGGEADHYSWGPSISADGRFVAFRSKAANLVTGDVIGKHDIFVHDRKTRRTERVNVSPSGHEANDLSQSASISADGRFVAYDSSASNLVPGDTNGQSDIFVRDRETGTTVRVSVSASGEQANRHCLDAAISADGRFVAFTSGATNLVPGDTNRSGDIFVAPNPLMP